MRKTIVIALVVLTGAMTKAGAAPAEHVRVTGTYSNLEYNEEAGDLVGVEVKIVPVSGGRLQPAVLVSEGEPAPMFLVDVRVSGSTVTFTVPGGEEGRTFQGSISAKGLKGTITYASGVKQVVTLPRRCGYWDR